MSLLNISKVYDLKNERETYEEEILKLKKKIKNPFVADIVFALSTSAVLNFAANLHDHYSLLEYLKYCIIDTPNYMPVGLVISYYIYELNKEKKEEINKLSEKIKIINERLEALQDVEEYYDYISNIINSNKEESNNDIVVRQLSHS